MLGHMPPTGEGQAVRVKNTASCERGQAGIVQGEASLGMVWVLLSSPLAGQPKELDGTGKLRAFMPWELEAIDEIEGREEEGGH